MVTRSRGKKFDHLDEPDQGWALANLDYPASCTPTQPSGSRGWSLTPPLPPRGSITHQTPHGAQNHARAADPQPSRQAKPSPNSHRRRDSNARLHREARAHPSHTRILDRSSLRPPRERIQERTPIVVEFTQLARVDPERRSTSIRREPIQIVGKRRRHMQALQVLALRPNHGCASVTLSSSIPPIVI